MKQNSKPSEETEQKVEKLIQKTKARQLWLLNNMKRTYAIVRKFYLKQAEDIKEGRLLMNWDYKVPIKDYHISTVYITGSKYITENNLKNAQLVIQLYYGQIMDPTPLVWLRIELLEEVITFCENTINYLEHQVHH